MLGPPASAARERDERFWSGPPDPFGVYVHIPFCAHRCDYCDFATWTDRASLMSDYVDACVTDYRRRDDAGQVRPATSIFFGGGTPSLLPTALLVRLVSAIDVAEDAEVTVECNPDSIDADKLAALADAGVTRISLGVQSMVQRVLSGLGRTHDPGNVARAVDGISSVGFHSWSLDLIYGARAERARDFDETLDAALALDPPHVSAYALTVEPATPLGSRIAAGTELAPDADTQADRYEICDQRLSAAGLEWYEISNWARPGHESRHNLGYWTGADYLAIGCAAHGFLRGERWWNVRTPERYIERVCQSADPGIGRERLDQDAAAEEEFALALRTRRGAPLAVAARPAAQTLADHGIVDLGADRVVLTRRGRLLATDVTARLLLAGAAPGIASGTHYD